MYHEIWKEGSAPLTEINMLTKISHVLIVEDDEETWENFKHSVEENLKKTIEDFIKPNTFSVGPNLGVVTEERDEGDIEETKSCAP